MNKNKGMESMNKIAIIGAGYTGMIAAKELIKDKNNEITIYEANEYVGGMTATFDAYGTRLEYFYRHIFKSDSYVIDLVRELGLEDKLIWPKTHMGYYTDNDMFEFGTPISLLKFKPLNLWDKFRFGLSVIKIKLIKDWKKLEQISAYEWLMKNAGKKAYEKIWEPLLISKFGSRYKEISMAWMWGKMVLRSSSTSADGEELGYIKGSYQTLTDALEKFIVDNGVKIIKNAKVSKIENKDGKVNILYNSNIDSGYNKVISTVAFPIVNEIADNMLSTSEKDKLASIDYTAARIMVLFLKNSQSKFYWLNNGDRSMPFGGLIEHTNFIDKSNYGGNNVIYISNYMFEDDRLYNITDEELLKEYIPMLKKIYKNFDEKDIVRTEVFKERYAQPMIVKDYSNKIPSFTTSSKGFYIASMPQIYPEDRGLNYAIRLGKEIAKESNIS